MTPSGYAGGPQCEAIEPPEGFMECSVHVPAGCPSVSVGARPRPGGDVVTEVAAAGRGLTVGSRGGQDPGSPEGLAWPRLGLGEVLAENKAARK